jgi:hypothetical protein
MYVRNLAFCERRDAPTSARTLLGQQMDRLGITLPAMLRLRWIIDAEPATPAPRTDPGDVVDIRSRMRDAGGVS